MLGKEVFVRLADSFGKSNTKSIIAVFIAEAKTRAGLAGVDQKRRVIDTGKEKTVQKNVDKARVGDIVVFERDHQTLHGKVTAKGICYVTSPFVPSSEPILFVRVIEHPEWKTQALLEQNITEVIITEERVQFT
jgi:uncharacterized protein YfaT (DUF1175 family)